MLDAIIGIDRAIFLFINVTLANPVTDLIMPIITNNNFLRILYALLVAALLVFGRKRFLWVTLFSILVVALTDQSASAWMKPFIARLRPCHVMEVHLLVNCGSGYSFPSSHAANLFGQAVFFGVLYRRYALGALIFAFLVGISRVFVGVHYPSDVVAGAVVGTIEGGIAAYLLRRIRGGVSKHEH